MLRGMITSLKLIDLDQELPGQRRFISCWVGRTADFSFIVDPGPPATADRLIAQVEEWLASQGLDRLDHILLTHIHLDHGGATAQVLERWPQARVTCHPKGRGHLIDPERLWQGSRQVLGHKAEVYGEPAPVPEAGLAAENAPLPAGLKVVPTPGHAPHHVAFVLGEHLFLGEAAGTFSTLGQGPEVVDYYLRPATPPRFFLPVAAASLDRLLELDPMPGHLCFAHHGLFSGDVPALLQAARAQLDLWVHTMAGWVDRNAGGVIPEAGPPAEAILPHLAAELARRDPHFARGAQLPADIREREADFTRQTLRGMLGYLRETQG